MENSSNLINWAIENKEKLDLEVTYLSGLKKYFNELYDISINLTYSGKQFEGRGTDKNEEIAFSKAISECIERISVAFYNIPHTNGIAAHTLLDKAQENAKFELIERDAFLVSFLLNRFNGITKKEKLADNSELITSNFQNNQLGFGYTTLINGINAIKPFGLIWGTAFNENESKSKLASQIEAFRKYSYIQNQGFTTISINEFYKLDKYNFIHHGQLSLNIEYAILLLKTLMFTQNIFVEKISDKFTYSEIPLDFIYSPPIKCVQAKNSNLQDLYLGPTTSEVINIERLRELSPEINLLNYNNLPHPID